MNHYVGIIIVSLCISAVFTLITKEDPRERWFYFLKLMAYMVVGSLLAAWVMYSVPW